MTEYAVAMLSNHCSSVRSYYLLRKPVKKLFFLPDDLKYSLLSPNKVTFKVEKRYYVLSYYTKNNLKNADSLI